MQQQYYPDERQQYYPDERTKSPRINPQGGRFTTPRERDRRAQLEQQFFLQAPRMPPAPSRPARRSTSRAPDGYMDMEQMKRNIQHLNEQLVFADETIKKLKTREKETNDRLALEVQKQVQLSGKFEDLSKGATRPSVVVEKYGLLYTQGRLDAMDNLDQIAGLSKYGKHQEMKQKILYGIMVASYKVSHDYLHQLKLNVRRLLGIPDKHPLTEKDAFGEAITFLTTYFQSTTQTFNIEPIFKDVQGHLVQLLPEFPSLSKLPGIASYTAECCRISWAMVNQIPPMKLEHSQDKFSAVMHTRFHTSSDKNAKVKMYVWPTLVDAGNKNILYKGVVWT